MSVRRAKLSAMRASLIGAGAAVLSSVLHAQPEETEPIDEIIVQVTPVGGTTGLSAEKIPYHVQSAFSDDIESLQSLHLADFLNRSMGSISINDAQNNPLQPDISYRGFTASPLLGLAQGLAVYQNGVRINEPLGDTVNWDLLPETAIDSIHQIGRAHV